MKRIGFTLMELLVVIAVVSIVSAILVPVFARVREDGRRTSCLSNLRQIGTATAMYCEDYDGRFPFGGDPSDLNTELWVSTPFVDEVAEMDPIQDVLRPYTVNPLVWRCPSDTGYQFSMTTSLSPVALNATPTAYQRFGDSYLYDTALAIFPVTLVTVTATDRNGGVHASSDIFLFMDSVGTWHGGAASGDNRYNLLFVDGHAKDLNANQTKSHTQLTIVPN